MGLPVGIPRLEDVENHCRGELYGDMLGFDDAFLEEQGSVVRRYAMRWGGAPMRLWSRRWEYPFAAQRIVSLAEETGRDELTVLDAGSGVTFFPFYVCRRLPGAQFVCCDSNAVYEKIFRRLLERTGDGSVQFRTAMLQDLPLEDESLDAICCISVLEHTDNYGVILDEFLRVLRPGGLLVMTFDISLDGRVQVDRPGAEKLLRSVIERFATDPATDYLGELQRLDDPTGLLTTDAIRQSDPSLLPWKWPVLKSIWDLLHGQGWSGGFFSLSCCCLDARAPQRDGASDG